LKTAQGVGQGSVSTPKLPTQTGRINVHVCIHTAVSNTDMQAKKVENCKKWSVTYRPWKNNPFYAVLDAPPPVSEPQAKKPAVQTLGGRES
jgi:hypothetical protein